MLVLVQGEMFLGAVGELAALCVKGKRETSCTKTIYGHDCISENCLRHKNATHVSRTLENGQVLQSFLLYYAF